MKSEKFDDFSIPKNSGGFLKFAHLADCHLGGWKDSKLEELNLKAFIYAIDQCIKEKVNFVLIAGDLFDNAIPSIDTLKSTAAEFRKLKDNEIDCYIIQGSHDYSLSGKSFVDVLESAGFCKNVKNGIETDKLVIHGVEGKKAGLEKNALQELKINLEKNSKVKIFMLHTTLTEVKPKGMDFVESTDASSLPEGFDYYAAGHIHIVSEFDINGKKIVYPGPLFPNNVQELEELGEGSFYIVGNESGSWRYRKQSIKFNDVLPLTINLDGKDAKISTEHALREIKKHDIKNKILILRFKGCFSSGKTSDIDFKKIDESLKDSYTILRNTKELTTPELKLEIKTESKDIDKIEEEVMTKYKENAKFPDLNEKIPTLMKALSAEKQEGELTKTFQSRLVSEISKIIDIE